MFNHFQKVLHCCVILLTLSFFLLCSAQGQWDVSSDTWDATDALGRALPTFETTGPPRGDKQIGVFYFLWNGRHGDEGPFDVNKILAQDPDVMQKKDSPLWGRMYVPHHWGESIFHYYVGEDEGVLRKHAQMLGDAGVDVVIFDVTNQLTYPESYRALCKVFSEVRAAGNHAPQIAFLTPFWSPNKVVKELWRELYSVGDYEDLWYRWDGKPLIMADPKLVGDITQMSHNGRSYELTEGNTFGQSFTTEQPFDRVAVCTPTWETRGAGASLTLRKDGPGGDVITSAKFDDVSDNEWLSLSLTQSVEPGTFYIEMTRLHGKIGLWGCNPNRALPGQGFVNGEPVDHNFAVSLGYDSELTKQILDFFTFRKPQPDYFVGPTGPNQWAWLEVYPQHGFYILDADGNRVTEQVAVGTAQNAVDGKLGVLSNPRSHGRSFHNGKEPPPEEQDFTGRNFAEQWRRAFELNPKFVFVTGWNEWIMGRFDETASFHGVDVVSFVDQFNTEFSRDIEPMIGGHGDNYYYQFIAYNRLFKGTRPVPKVVPQPITIDGTFDDWQNVSPEFRDTIGDPVHRDERGWGKDTRYTNQTGRNDLIAAKVSFDAENVYFYVRTKDAIIGAGESNWMMLFIDADGNHETGWLGYDLIVNRNSLSIAPGQDTNSQVTRVTLEKNVGNGYTWDTPVEIACRVAENEMELAIPITTLTGGKAQLPDFLRFKWADNIQQTGEWSDFTLNGDVAPNDRYNYRAVFR